MKRASIAFGVLSLLTVSLAAGFGSDPPSKKTPAENSKSSIMQRKLLQAQKLLEGLVQSDFSKMQAAADELAILRQKAEWMALKTRDYELFTSDFQRNIEAMQKAAKNKNLDAATLAYVDMTFTCVRCHKYVREEGTARIPVGFDGLQLVRHD